MTNQYGIKVGRVYIKDNAVFKVLRVGTRFVTIWDINSCFEGISRVKVNNFLNNFTLKQYGCGKRKLF